MRHADSKPKLRRAFVLLGIVGVIAGGVLLGGCGGGRSSTGSGGGGSTSGGQSEVGKEVEGSAKVTEKDIEEAAEGLKEQFEK